MPLPLPNVVANRIALGQVNPGCLICNVTTQPGVWLLLVFFSRCWLFIVAFFDR